MHGEVLMFCVLLVIPAGLVALIKGGLRTKQKLGLAAVIAGAATALSPFVTGKEPPVHYLIIFLVMVFGVVALMDLKSR